MTIKLSERVYGDAPAHRRQAKAGPYKQKDAGLPTESVRPAEDAGKPGATLECEEKAPPSKPEGGTPAGDALKRAPTWALCGMGTAMPPAGRHAVPLQRNNKNKSVVDLTGRTGCPKGDTIPAASLRLAMAPHKIEIL
jgi:hypothetical protein